MLARGRASQNRHRLTAQIAANHPLSRNDLNHILALRQAAYINAVGTGFVRDPDGYRATVTFTANFVTN
jgi:hypothetical protein